MSPFSARRVQSFLPGPENLHVWAEARSSMRGSFIRFTSERQKQGSVGWLHECAVLAPAICITISAGRDWCTPSCQKSGMRASLCEMQTHIYSPANGPFAACRLFHEYRDAENAQIPEVRWHLSQAKITIGIDQCINKLFVLLIHSIMREEQITGVANRRQ